MSSSPLLAPAENDFLTSFGVEPIESAPQDGYWAYVFDGPDGSRVQFSFNTHEASIQTILFVGDVPVLTVVSEDAQLVRIGEEGAIYASFGGNRRLTVRVFPSLSVEWSFLQSN